MAWLVAVSRRRTVALLSTALRSRRIATAFLAADSPTGEVGPHCASAAPSLVTSRRWQSGPSKTRHNGMQYVAMEVPELRSSASDAEEGAVNAGAFRGLQAVDAQPTEKDDGGGEGGAHGSAPAAPTEVDLTSVEKLAGLEKLYHRPHTSVALLSLRDQQLFSRMIYDAFYKDGARSAAVDPALLYQASLEVQWMEEAVGARVGELGLSVDEARRQLKRHLLERVDLHKPLSYIIGSQPFFGCDIRCEPPLLCPRPETEMWTHWLVYHHLARAERSAAGSTASSASPLHILDVCCGTGCIGVALAKHLPSAIVTAVDILPEAVRVATENARHNGLAAERYTALQSDMFDHFLVPQPAPQWPGPGSDNAAERPLGTVADRHAGTVDVLVANPPYVLPEQYVDLPRSITHWESKTALVGDDYRESRQYLYFKELCVHGAAMLKPRRHRHPELRNAPNIAIEVGLQAHMVAELMDKSQLWRDVEVHLDYAQQERWITANSTH
ncbi:Mitochondrial N(5)-glutamine methyltransferase MTQ1 [Novymonas esmeraldas]|uniref:Mitochondrial N(5)-glutamine methyltransferase MTQ1 n=1 Tax=Novymonas esmeraldas TaxID=1808958 RepID=A0AAW0F5W4_9TRYP